MVDFDAAVAAVQDPNADPVFLAKIAYENPEFGANVVANPRAYRPEALGRPVRRRTRTSAAGRDGVAGSTGRNHAAGGRDGF